MPKSPGDFLVREAIVDQPDDSAFPRRQIVVAAILPDALRQRRYAPHQHGRHAGRASEFAAGASQHGSDQLLRRGIAHDECGDPSLGAAQRLLLLVLHTIGEDLDPGHLRARSRTVVVWRATAASTSTTSGARQERAQGHRRRPARLPPAHTAIGRQQARETFLIQADVGHTITRTGALDRRGFVRGLWPYGFVATAIEEQVHEWRTASVNQCRTFNRRARAAWSVVAASRKEIGRLAGFFDLGPGSGPMDLKTESMLEGGNHLRDRLFIFRIRLFLPPTPGGRLALRPTTPLRT